DNETAYSFVVFGASGKLSLTKVFPALWQLYRDNRLPQATNIFMFCRTHLEVKNFRLQCVPHMGLDKNRDPLKYNSFWSNVHSYRGMYDNPQDYVGLKEYMVHHETKHNCSIANRIFYLAIPPVLFDNVTLNISRKCQSTTGWNHVIVEKPFGRNEITYKPYQTQLCQTFKESQIYMIDHFLSKKILQNWFVVRFTNLMWAETWDCKHISSIMISMKCERPVVTRPEYFNQFGIIRDLMTNTMMQLLLMLTIEQPYSNNVEDLRDEKMKVLRKIVTLDINDVVIGQYCNNGVETDPAKVGYTQHPYIPRDSQTPTFATAVLHINNKRWSGVPFILRVGKAMNVSKTEIRVQYKSLDCDISAQSKSIPNELVMRLAPKEELFLRMMLKAPGKDALCLREHEMNLMLWERNPVGNNYQNLLLDVFAGNHMFFMRSDEQCEVWRIFSPVLYYIDVERPKPMLYDFGSMGPMAAYELAAANGFKFYQPVEWHRKQAPWDEA
ncbi:hypothetical protein KR222_006104, partial [Zaprionus bogoriensis]